MIMAPVSRTTKWKRWPVSCCRRSRHILSPLRGSRNSHSGRPSRQQNRSRQMILNRTNTEGSTVQVLPSYFFADFHCRNDGFSFYEGNRRRSGWLVISRTSTVDGADWCQNALLLTNISMLFKYQPSYIIL